jgi:hypothetical protein
MCKGAKGGRTAEPAERSGGRGDSALRSGNVKPLPSRVAKKRALERIQHDTLEVRSGSLIPMLRRQGYDELPLDEDYVRFKRGEGVTVHAETIQTRQLEAIVTASSRSSQSHRRAEALGDLVEAVSARRRSDVFAAGSDEFTPPPGGYKPIGAPGSAMR